MTPQKIDITIGDTEYTIMLLDYIPADHGCICGTLPENCYPPQPSEANFDLVDSDGFLCDDEAIKYEDVIMDKIDEYMEDNE